MRDNGATVSKNGFLTNSFYRSINILVYDQKSKIRKEEDFDSIWEFKQDKSKITMFKSRSALHVIAPTPEQLAIRI